jgi:hypothetical protein
LQEIQRIVGAEDTVYGQVRAPQDAVEVNIKLSELVRLCPQAFKDPESLQQASQTVIQVAVPGLYDQLTKGRVTTKLHLLTADIPVDYLAPYAAEHAEDAVPLPLHMVVGSLQPEDLRRRTASQERDLGDKLLPNLFTPASVAAAAAEAPVAPVAPAAEEVAPSPARAGGRAGGRGGAGGRRVRRAGRGGRRVRAGRGAGGRARTGTGGPRARRRR